MFNKLVTSKQLQYWIKYDSALNVAKLSDQLPIKKCQYYYRFFSEII